MSEISREALIKTIENLSGTVARLEASGISYEFLLPEFLEAINEVCLLGYLKHGEQSFHARRLAGNRSREERFSQESLALHAKQHVELYRQGVPHDRLLTLRHQLAAAALNLMIEFYCAGLDEDYPPMKCRECGTTNPPSGWYPMLSSGWYNATTRESSDGQLCNACDKRMRAG